MPSIPLYADRVAFIDGLFDRLRLGPQSQYTDVIDAMAVFLDLCYRGGQTSLITYKFNQ